MPEFLIKGYLPSSRFASAMPPIKSLKDFKGSKLSWVQPRALERYHELRSDQDVYATLTWLKVFGSLAEAQTTEGKFTLKRGGFMRPYVTIRDVALDNDIAVLKIGMFGHGTIEFSNGKRITVISKRFWSFEWEFIDENGQTLCSIRQRAKVMKYSADVSFFELVRKDHDLMTILLLGWYTIILMSQEAATASAGAASS
jgi:hypothetical protein